MPVIPADLDEATLAEVRRLAVEAFKAVDCSGLARVDFLLARETGTLYVNEVNTLPGFTTISMYLEALGRLGPGLPGAARPADQARARAPCRQTGAAHECHLKLTIDD